MTVNRDDDSASPRCMYMCVCNRNKVEQTTKQRITQERAARMTRIAWILLTHHIHIYIAAVAYVEISRWHEAPHAPCIY